MNTTRDVRAGFLAERLNVEGCGRCGALRSRSHLLCEQSVAPLITPPLEMEFGLCVQCGLGTWFHFQVQRVAPNVAKHNAAMTNTASEPSRLEMLGVRVGLH